MWDFELPQQSWACCHCHYQVNAGANERCRVPNCFHRRCQDCVVATIGRTVMQTGLNTGLREVPVQKVILSEYRDPSLAHS